MTTPGERGWDKFVAQDAKHPPHRLILRCLGPRHSDRGETHENEGSMDWNAQLDWSEEVFAMLVILPPPLILIAILWLVAPRFYRRRGPRIGNE